jgi:hypothetical protein
VAAELGACRRAREREGERPGREEKVREWKRGSWRSNTAPGGRFGGLGKQEVAGNLQGASTQELSVLNEEDKVILQKAPWASGFSGNFENRTLFALFGKSNLF